METLTTEVNPGFAKKYKLKSLKNILGIILSKVRNKKFRSAFFTLIAESENYYNGRVFFKKGTFFCPICNTESGAFVHIANNFQITRNSACPNCMCRARHRGLYFLYNEYLEKLSRKNSPVRILHFAPEPIFYNLFKNNKNWEYLTADYYLEDVDYPGVDIQNLKFNDEEFDLILCNHVIEHVERDDLTLKELYRILKPGGRAFITVPGDFDKSETVYFETLENNGHYRHYGLDFIDKVNEFFDECRVEDLGKYNIINDRTLAIPNNELCFIGKKL